MCSKILRHGNGKAPSLGIGLLKIRTFRAPLCKLSRDQALFILLLFGVYRKVINTSLMIHTHKDVEKHWNNYDHSRNYPDRWTLNNASTDQWNVNNSTGCENCEPGHLSAYGNRHRSRALTSTKVRTKFTEEKIWTWSRHQACNSFDWTECQESRDILRETNS